MADKLISTWWRTANVFFTDLQAKLPKMVQDGIHDLSERIPIGPPRHPDSGDLIYKSGFVDSSLLSNLMRRYVGTPAQRARAWEESAVIMDRLGWRLSNEAYAQAFSLRSIEGDLPADRKSGETIFQSEHFRVIVPRGLLVDRKDGGHLTIYPVVETNDMMQLTPAQAKEYAPFVMAVGRAFQDVMNESGIRVERLNIQDMGNWRLLTPQHPHFHLHVFGRARSSRFQIHGEFMKIPPKGSKHYLMLEPINAEEVAKLRDRIPRYFAEFSGSMNQAAAPLSEQRLTLRETMEEMRRTEGRVSAPTDHSSAPDIQVAVREDVAREPRADVLPESERRGRKGSERKPEERAKPHR